MKEKDTSRIYLDYAASTPVRDEVLSAMEAYWQQVFANPQATIHTPGREARKAVSESRERISSILGVQASEIVFTSGATEANSLAILGSMKSARDRIEEPSVLVNEISHGSVTQINQDKFNVDTVPVDSSGRMNTEALESLVDPNTALVSCEYVNNEIGTIQPVRQVSKAASGDDLYPLVHTDASQAPVFLPLNPERLGVDMMTINGQKMYGPKGVGVLWVKSGTPVQSLLINDSKEHVGDYQGVRPGTPPVPLIVGMAQALEWAQNHYEKHREQITAVRDYGIRQLNDTFSEIRINGSRDHRVANNISVSFLGVDHDYLATKLDREGIACATTSACQSGSGKSSVVARIENQTQQALRFSLGIHTTQSDMDTLVNTLRGCLDGAS